MSRRIRSLLLALLLLLLRLVIEPDILKLLALLESGRLALEKAPRLMQLAVVERGPGEAREAVRIEALAERDRISGHEDRALGADVLMEGQLWVRRRLEGKREWDMYK